MARWNGTNSVRPGLPAGPSRFQALAMVRDRDGNLWIGTDSRGLLRLNGDGVASLLDQGDEPGAGPHQAVTAVFEDREGNLWIGSAGGLERLRDSAFVTYSTPEGLPTDGSNPVYVDAENRMWFPPVNGGLWWVKNGQHGRIAQAGLESDVVYSIAGGKNELWLGRERGGLTRLYWPDGPSAGSFTAETYTTGNGLAQNSVYSVYEARDGTVWAGTLSGGVSTFRDGKFTTYTIETGLASNTVASILEASDGTMWFATPNGLSALVKDRWVSYAPRDGLPSENVNCLFEDSTGILWVGTAAGLAFRGSGGFQARRRRPRIFARAGSGHRRRPLRVAVDRNFQSRAAGEPRQAVARHSGRRRYAGVRNRGRFARRRRREAPSVSGRGSARPDLVFDEPRNLGGGSGPPQSKRSSGHRACAIDGGG